MFCVRIQSVLAILFKQQKLRTLLLGFLEYTSFVCGIFTLYAMGLLLQAVVNKDSYLFLFYLVVEISVVIVRLTIEYLLIAIREKHVVKLRMNISSHLYKKLFSENPFVVSKNPGEYTSWFYNDLETICEGGQSCLSLIVQAFNIVSVLGFMFVLSPALGGIFLGLIILFTFFPTILEKSTAQSGALLSKVQESFTHKFSNLLSGYKIFRHAGKTKYFLRTFKNEIQPVFKSKLKVQAKLFAAKYFQYFLVSVPGIVMLPSAALLVYFSYADFPTFVLATRTANIGSMIVMNLSQAIFQIKRAKDIFAKFRTQIFAHNTDFTTEPFEVLRVNRLKVTVQGHEIPLLSNLTFAFERGQKYAIVGRSGIGKSSLIKAIFGFLSIDEGEIFWNNTKINPMHTSSFLSKINFVASTDVIVPAPLRDNLTLFNSNVSEKLIRNLTNFLGLNHIKLDQMVDKDVVSAGEQQRILLAKVFLFPKEVLILDEALANIDKEKRQIIEQHFLKDPNLTFIHITHHLENWHQYYKVINLEEKNCD